MSAWPDMDALPATVQCIACGQHAFADTMDESSDEDGPWWTCMNRAECLRRVRQALKSQPDIGSATWISEVADEVAKLGVRVAELEREVRRLRARNATYN
jgi:hypothetical protein